MRLSRPYFAIDVQQTDQEPEIQPLPRRQSALCASTTLSGRSSLYTVIPRKSRCVKWRLLSRNHSQTRRLTRSELQKQVRIYANKRRVLQMPGDEPLRGNHEKQPYGAPARTHGKMDSTCPSELRHQPQPPRPFPFALHRLPPVYRAFPSAEAESTPRRSCHPHPGVRPAEGFPSVSSAPRERRPSGPVLAARLPRSPLPLLPPEVRHGWTCY